MVFYHVNILPNDIVEVTYQDGDLPHVLTFLQIYFPIEVMFGHYLVLVNSITNEAKLQIICEPENVLKLSGQLDKLTIKQVAKEANFHPN